MNIYRGCQHQCIYCDSRSECYRIENFNDILVKINAPEKLTQELSSKRVKGTVCFGSMNDSYMPIEQKYKLTRKCLDIIRQFRFPIHLMTKSDLVLRDLDIIKEISKVYAAVTFTITTSSDAISRKVEVGAPVSSKRFAAMKKLSDNGIYTGISMMPILPFIEDTKENIESIVMGVKESGGKYIIPSIGMTLRDRQRDYYYKKLDELFPGLSDRYRKTYGGSYSCECPNAGELYSLLVDLCHKNNIQIGMNHYQCKGVDEEDSQLGFV